MSTPGGERRGTQAERTVLAWTRTSLALLGAVVAVARLAAESSLLLAVVVAAIGVPLTTATFWTIDRRYHHRSGSPDGRLPALTAALATLVGLAALAQVLVS